MRGLRSAAGRVGFCLSLAALGAFLVGARTGSFLAVVLLVASAFIALKLAPMRGPTRAWFIYLVGFAVFAYLRARADQWGPRPEYSYVIGADRLLALGHDPSVVVQADLRRGSLDWAATFVYLSYFLVPHATLAWLSVARREVFRRALLAMLVTYFAGLAWCIAVPTAPPWLAADAGRLSSVDFVVRDVTQSTNHAAYRAGNGVAGTNDVAAMPSLHMAQTVLVVAAMGAIGKKAQLAAFGYAALMAFALVYSGSHYLVDLVAGTLLAWCVWWLSGLVWGWRGLQQHHLKPGRAGSEVGAAR